jgi:hypothetical protein
MSCLESAQREDFHERQAGRLALHPVLLVLSFSGFATENAERPAEAGPFYLLVVCSRIVQGATGKLGTVVSLPSQDLAQFPVNVRSILRGLIDQLDPLLPRRLQLHLTQ